VATGSCISPRRPILKLETIVVKFTTKYGKDLHQICADMELSGGSCGIAMENIPSAFCQCIINHSSMSTEKAG